MNDELKVALAMIQSRPITKGELVVEPTGNAGTITKVSQDRVTEILVLTQHGGGVGYTAQVFSYGDPSEAMTRLRAIQEELEKISAASKGWMKDKKRKDDE